MAGKTCTGPAAMPDNAPHIFGIRHHGPGSARSLLRALEDLQPDAILVEGPPEAEAALPMLTHEGMTPPVALLLYVPDAPHRAVYYPFAVFSPEWQALQYALRCGVPVRFMDLPQAHSLALRGNDTEIAAEPAETPQDDGTTAPDAASESPKVPYEPEDPEEPVSPLQIRQDPLSWLASAAGYPDGERWWEAMVEHRQEGAELFTAILEVMTALRSEWERAGMPNPNAEREALREAFMRQTIRHAQKAGYQRIAVVCGAWHAPALAQDASAKEDIALLKGLPKVKVEATWIPWTYDRLSLHTGYGAGIESPGWYHHLWTALDKITIRWMAGVARLLREQDLDASSAHVIEAVRLAETLAALRELSVPGLDEMNEAARAVFCFGSNAPMRLIARKLIVGETIGSVPDETPMAPLQAELRREKKRLRLPDNRPEKNAVTASGREPLKLDLRDANHLEKSQLLHRLSLLGIGWGTVMQSQGGALGTFWETWTLRWIPEYEVAVIEAGLWGNTILDAAAAKVRSQIDKAPDLPTLTRLLQGVLLADLGPVVGHLMGRLEAEAALASDTGLLMEALPPLATVLRYGDVRGADRSLVSHVMDGLVARICVGLPAACASLNDEAAAAMFTRLTAVHSALGLLQNEDYRQEWDGALRQLADRTGLHGLIAGRCCRFLLDAGAFGPEETARRMALALSTASAPSAAAAWVEGLLKGSGEVILHDDALWAALDGWLVSLRPDAFKVVLPLLRRTFSEFPVGERRRMGERARLGEPRLTVRSGGDNFSIERAEAILPIISRLLGLEEAAR